MGSTKQTKTFKLYNDSDLIKDTYFYTEMQKATIKRDEDEDHSTDEEILKANKKTCL